MTYPRKFGLFAAVVLLVCAIIFMYDRYAPPTQSEQQLYKEFSPLMSEINQANGERKQYLPQAIETGDKKKLAAMRDEMESLHRQIGLFKAERIGNTKNRVTRLINDYDGSLKGAALACKMVEEDMPNPVHNAKRMLSFADLALERAERIRQLLQ